MEHTNNNIVEGSFLQHERAFFLVSTTLIEEFEAFSTSQLQIANRLGLSRGETRRKIAATDAMSSNFRKMLMTS